MPSTSTSITKHDDTMTLSDKTVRNQYQHLVGHYVSSNGHGIWDQREEEVEMGMSGDTREVSKRSFAKT
jgi:hypothetical protein